MPYTYHTHINLSSTPNLTLLNQPLHYTTAELANSLLPDRAKKEARPRTMESRYGPRSTSQSGKRPPGLSIGLSATSPPGSRSGSRPGSKPGSRGGSPVNLSRSNSSKGRSPVNSFVPVKSPAGGQLAPLDTNKDSPTAPQPSLESSQSNPMHSPMPISGVPGSPAQRALTDPGPDLTQNAAHAGTDAGTEDGSDWPENGFGEVPRPLSVVGQRRQNCARAVGLDATFFRYE